MQIPGSTNAWANFLGREIAPNVCLHFTVLTELQAKRLKGFATEPHTRRIHGGYKCKKRKLKNSQEKQSIPDKHLLTLIDILNHLEQMLRKKELRY